MRAEYDVFLSYHWGNNTHTAKLLTDRLKEKGLRVFWDRDEMREGNFDEQILMHIRNTPNFVPVLTVDAIQNFRKADSWMRREIECALSEHKNIVPVFMPGIPWDTFPDSIRELKRKQGVPICDEYIDAMIERLYGYLEWTRYLTMGDFENSYTWRNGLPRCDLFNPSNWFSTYYGILLSARDVKADDVLRIYGRMPIYKGDVLTVEVRGGLCLTQEVRQKKAEDPYHNKNTKEIYHYLVGTNQKVILSGLAGVTARISCLRDAFMFLQCSEVQPSVNEEEWTMVTMTAKENCPYIALEFLVNELPMQRNIFLKRIPLIRKKLKEVSFHVMFRNFIHQHGKHLQDAENRGAEENSSLQRT